MIAPIRDYKAPPKAAPWTGVYVTKELRPVTWWERGMIRYCVLSYSLWARTIWRGSFKK